MAYAMPGTPTMIDSDNDGFIDVAYIGDLGGNLWRFKFCSAADGILLRDGSNWSGSRLFAREAGIGPVYDAPTATRDTSGNIWLYWGTGDKAEPIVVGGGTDRLFAVKDTTMTGTLRSTTSKTSRAAPIPTTRPKPAGTSTSRGPARSASPIPPSSGARSTSPPTPPQPAPAIPAARRARQSSTPSPTSAAPGPSGRQPQPDARRGHPHGARSVHEPLQQHAGPLCHRERRRGDRLEHPEGERHPPSIANQTNILYWRDRRIQ